ncbi:MAG: hypothetical protein GY906_10245 [bacterium]|nr:hypothetical protein [bacterium]
MAKWTDQQKMAALAMYAKHGTAATVEATGIPRRTILRWASDAGIVAQASSEKTSEARAVSSQQATEAWGDYREKEALLAGAAASKMRRGIAEASDASNHLLLRARSIAYGIMIDKAELLSGRATSRIEHWAESELDTEIRELMTEMQNRTRESGKTPLDDMADEIDAEIDAEIDEDSLSVDELPE